MATDIFISYRREGGREIARTVYLALGKLGYQNIFFDYNSIRNGVFNTQIIDAINNCKDFLLILSKGSLDRCINDNDWVRKEITTAIEAGCNIIPVTIDGNKVEFPEEFPRNLKIIRMIQFSKLLTNEFFDDSIMHISERLISKPITNQTQAEKEDSFILTITTDETCDFYIGNERISKIKMGKFRRIDQLKPGNKYSFKFISLASKNCVINVDYEVPLIKKTDELKISFLDLKENNKKDFLQIEEKKKRERELKQINKNSLRAMLKEYSDHDIKAYNGMTLVCKDNLYGFLDEQGLEVIPCVYEDALHFSEGLACVKDSLNWSYIDTLGSHIGITSDTPSYVVDQTIIISKGNRYGLVSVSGQCLVATEYDDIALPCGHIYAGKKKEKYVYFNNKGELINPLQFNSIPFEQVGIRLDGNKASHNVYVSTNSENSISKVSLPAYVRLNNRVGKIDKYAKQIIPCIADELNEIHNTNLVHSIINGKHGIFCSNTGKVIIPSIYRCFKIIDGYYNYWWNMEQSVIASKEPNARIQPDGYYDKHLPYTENASLGLLDFNGKCLIPFDYNFIFPSKNYFEYEAITIMHKDVSVELERLFILMELFESSARSYLEEVSIDSDGQKTYYIVDGDDKNSHYYKEYQSILKKVHYKKDIYVVGGPQNLIARYDINRGIVKTEFEHKTTDELSLFIDELSFFNSNEKRLENKELVVTDQYTIKDFDRIEDTFRNDISFVFMGGRCGVFNKLRNQLLSNISFDVLKLSEFESLRSDNISPDRCSFNFAKNGKRGTFELFFSDDGKVYYDDELLKFEYSEEEIRLIFE